MSYVVRDTLQQADRSQPWLDRAELAEDIRTAEAQLNRGEGVTPDTAQEQVLRLLGK